MTKAERIAFLEETLAIDTTNANETLVADIIAKYLDKAKIASKQITFSPGRSNLIAEIGGDGPVFGLSGHMDVVPAGNLDLWTTPPFTPTTRDGKIYARGACDMKSGLIAMAIAMIELVEEKADLKGKVRLLATVGEETGLYGAKQLTDEGYADDMDALIISEPSGHKIVYAHKGVYTYSVTSYGKSAHSSMPELGINAIDNLLMFYNEMMKVFADELKPVNSALGPTVYCNSVIQGGEQFNIVPELAKFTANLRTIPEVPNDHITEILEGIVAKLNDSVEGMKLELEVEQSDLPMFSSMDSKLVQISTDEATKAFGEEPELLGAPGATDAAQFIRGNKDMEIIIFGPGNESMHQANEYVDIDNYLEMIDLYKTIILRYFES